MNRAVFFDRDGTIAHNAHYCRRPEDFKLFLGAAKAIRLLNEKGFKVIIVTNQSGIGRGYFDEVTLGKIHGKMKAELASQGAHVDGIYYCPHHPEDNCECRKPKPALVFQAARDFNIDLRHSFVVGDLQMDIDLGRAAGCRTILVGDTPSNSDGLSPDAVVADLAAVPDVILGWRVDEAEADSQR